MRPWPLLGERWLKENRRDSRVPESISVPEYLSFISLKPWNSSKWAMDCIICNKKNLLALSLSLCPVMLFYTKRQQSSRDISREGKPILTWERKRGHPEPYCSWDQSRQDTPPICLKWMLLISILYVEAASQVQFEAGTLLSLALPVPAGICW